MQMEVVAHDQNYLPFQTIYVCTSQLANSFRKAKIQHFEPLFD